MVICATTHVLVLLPYTWGYHFITARKENTFLPDFDTPLGWKTNFEKRNLYRNLRNRNCIQEKILIDSLSVLSFYYDF